MREVRRFYELFIINYEKKLETEENMRRWTRMKTTWDRREHEWSGMKRNEGYKVKVRVREWEETESEEKEKRERRERREITREVNLNDPVRIHDDSRIQKRKNPKWSQIS